MTIDARGFLHLVQARRSVRSYRPEPVDPAVITRCLEAARLAPSACNSQPWTFIVVDEPARKNEVADLTTDRLLPLNHFTRQAPILVVVVVEKQNLSARFGAVAKKRPLAWIDMGIAVEHFCLQAAAEGLGTCILGWFKERQIKSLLRIPSTKRIGLLITLGHPVDDRVPPKVRKDMETVACRNRYEGARSHG